MAIPTFLSVRRLSIGFGNAMAVRDVSFDIAAGEVLGLVGESGSGKSLSALAIMGLLPPQAAVSGEIFFRGRDLRTLLESEMRRLRGAQIAIIF